MIIEALALDGSFLVKPEPHADERGHFARTFCRDEFREHGMVDHFVQQSLSFNHKAGTLRGLHYQVGPHSEIKLVRCTRGSVFDVIVDLRRASATLGQWVGVELSEQNAYSLYIPAGFAHGFITLEDNAELLYQMDQPYAPGAARAVRWDSMEFNIKWPAIPQVISDNDRCATPGFESQ